MVLEEQLVTVVIPVWNSGRWLSACLESLCSQTFREFSLILVDNGSSDGSVQTALGHLPIPVKTITFSENRGFAAAVNAGIKNSKTKYIALLNVDTLVDPEWMMELVKTMDQHSGEVGALASAMVCMNEPRLVDDAGDSLSWYGSAIKRGHGCPVQNFKQQDEVISVCAGAALYRKEFFMKVGLFDEEFTSYLEDIDLCLRGRILGFKYLYVPTALVRHQGHSAGVVGHYYVFLMTRNRVIIFLKNIPAFLLLKHLHQIIYGQFYYFLVYRKPIASLRGYFALFRIIPHIMKERNKIVKHTKTTGKFFDSLLVSELGEPTLGELVKRKFK